MATHEYLPRSHADQANIVAGDRELRRLACRGAGNFVC
jgi:hypothetical protein